MATFLTSQALGQKDDLYIYIVCEAASHLSAQDFYPKVVDAENKRAWDKMDVGSMRLDFERLVRSTDKDADPVKVFYLHSFLMGVFRHLPHGLVEEFGMLYSYRHSEMFPIIYDWARSLDEKKYNRDAVRFFKANWGWHWFTASSPSSYRAAKMLRLASSKYSQGPKEGRIANKIIGRCQAALSALPSNLFGEAKEVTGLPHVLKEMLGISNDMLEDATECPLKYVELANKLKSIPKNIKVKVNAVYRDFTTLWFDPLKSNFWRGNDDCLDAIIRKLKWGIGAQFHKDWLEQHPEAIIQT